MTDKNKAIENLHKAYEIVEQFDDIVKTELVEKQKLLPMTDGYEGLASALGYIGAALDALSDPENPSIRHKRLVIEVPETRALITDAHQACTIVSKNLHPEGELMHATMFLESCFYSLLNAVYQDDAQSELNRVLEICECGDEALDTIESVPDEKCDEEYLNPAGQRIHPRIKQFREVFSKLRPKYDGRKESE